MGRPLAPRRPPGAEDGFYVARFTMTLPGGRRDVRRIALRREDGAWRVAGAYYRRQSCGLLTSFKLSSPVFGGRRDRAEGIAYRLGAPARVTVTVRRGARVVRRYAARDQRAHRTVRLRLSAEGLAPGSYRVELRAVGSAGTVVAALTAHRM